MPCFRPIAIKFDPHAALLISPNTLYSECVWVDRDDREFAQVYRRKFLSPAKKSTDIEQRGITTKRDGSADFRYIFSNPCQCSRSFSGAGQIVPHCSAPKLQLGGAIMLGSCSG